MEAYISHGADIVESNQNALEVLSPEDIAWADSCLANDIGISGNALDVWSNLTDALNETVIPKPNPPPPRWADMSFEGTVFLTPSYKDTVDISSENMDATFNGVLTSNLESATLGFGQNMDAAFNGVFTSDLDSATLGLGLNMDAAFNGVFTSNLESATLGFGQNMDTTVVNGIFNSIPETAPSGWGDVSSVVRELLTSQNMAVDDIFSSTPEVGGDEVITEKADRIPGSRFNSKNVFQPTYSEAPKGRGSTSYDHEQSEVLGHQQEESFEDIFKVWNLETHVDDDELGKQYYKAFSGSIIPAPYDLESGSLDGVIRSMGDLSLNRRVA